MSAMVLGVQSFNVGQRCIRDLDWMIYLRRGGFNESNKDSLVTAEAEDVGRPSDLGKGM